MWYHYYSPIGVFWIRPQPACPGSYWLGVDDMPLKAYPSPELAVDEVYRQNIGFEPWDGIQVADIPKSLSEWNVGKPQN